MKKSPTTVTKKQGWGGKRAGSGRKPGPYAGTSKVTTIVLTAALIEKLHKLGGSSWVREQIIKTHAPWGYAPPHRHTSRTGRR